MRPRILLVEDDAALRDSVAEVLRRAGADVFSSDEGRKALELMEAWRPRVVLLDLAMAGMNGKQFREEQRSRPALARIPVVIMTAATDPSVRGDALLLKPFDDRQLLATVARFVPGLGVPAAGQR